MSEPNTNASEATAQKQVGRQVLSFTLEQETYAVDILRVREIRGFSAVTHMPDTPSHLLGVLNLRGSIVPIVDMRRRIGVKAMEPSALTVIIVLSVESARGRREFGLVVDGVSDVVDLAPENIKEAPDLNDGNREQLISAIASVNDRLIMVLDIDRMLAVEKLDMPAAA